MLHMTLTADDRLAIADLIHRHGHLVDSGELDQLDAIFTTDVVYDVSDFNGQKLIGIDAIREAALALGERNPLGHHVTNVVVSEGAGGTVCAQSKGIGVSADGTCGSVVYEDTLIKTRDGWRISRRAIIGRRTPLSR
jgi:SnoaL-like domain